MAVLFDPSGSQANLQEMILSASSLPCVNGLMILAFDANGFVPENIDGVLRRLALEAFPDKCEPGLKIIMDCISRVLFLGDRFREEIEVVNHGTRPTIGACTIGEIGNCGTEYLEFYNKTAVVAVLEAT
ncbi:hypothetical protein SBDP1_320012 [Syntrophobacter sp. SbD1]|nr:hypothetical protein SBDP1_320012 [Syntrophobacter sp. SbD1]